eukprot:TRINITY_DN11287_c0_g1_i1.p1 TRINITY_DN11287_c0_g1~~TRINITY_DN11287_c0_g1_i1.p1  ORF type:complete len:1223 (-),score=133.34 TRINITY_DN11287_c0_g1_i1:71-3739(-)
MNTDDAGEGSPGASASVVTVEAASPLVDGDVEDEICCRICRMGEEAGRLNCPCRCAGSIKWIHESCLRAWLQSQDSSRNVCELCGHHFEFVPVYAENAPRRLTCLDWVSALAMSIATLSGRTLRIAYALALWAVALPILTVSAAGMMFAGEAPPFPWSESPSALPFTTSLFLGECLSVSGIALIYSLGALRSFLLAIESGNVLVADSADHHLTEDNALVTESAPGENAVGTDLVVQPPNPQALAGVVEHDDTVESEEDLWNVMGILGDPSRAFLCMVTFLCANVLGMTVFFGIPFHIGRSFLRGLLPFFAYISIQNDSSALLTQGPAWGLLSIGIGYLGIAALSLIVVPFVAAVCFFCGYSSRSLELICVCGVAGVTQVSRTIKSLWLKLLTLSSHLLQLVFLPCYMGHLVMCLLCGPVLHMPQDLRATFANSNLPLTLAMQLFIGYLHLWGVGFLESCFEEICTPAASRLPFANFFFGALCSHRRLFGTGATDIVARLAEEGVIGPTILVPESAVLKFVLVHVVFQTPLAFVLWYVPAQFLNVVLGDALFPVHLVDRRVGSFVGAGADAVVNRTSFLRDGMGVIAVDRVRTRIVGSDVEGASDSSGFDMLGSAASGGSGADSGSQQFLAVEMFQLYFVLLQCLRALDASHGFSHLVARWLRATLRRLGFQQDPPGLHQGQDLLQSSSVPFQEHTEAPIDSGAVIGELGSDENVVAAEMQENQTTPSCEISSKLPSASPRCAELSQEQASTLLSDNAPAAVASPVPLTESAATAGDERDQDDVPCVSDTDCSFAPCGIFPDSPRLLSSPSQDEDAQRTSASRPVENVNASPVTSPACPTTASSFASPFKHRTGGQELATTAAVAAAPAASPFSSVASTPIGSDVAPAVEGAGGALDGFVGFVLAVRVQASISSAPVQPPCVSSHMNIPSVRELLVAASLLVSLAWVCLALLLSVPLSVGRILHRSGISPQADRVSDFLPLSLGVVFLSSVIFGVAKLAQGVSAIGGRVSTVQNQRCLHLMHCIVSFWFMSIMALVLLPLGVGTLLLRLLLPLQSHSGAGLMVPVVFLVTDCWVLGLVLTKVAWRLVQTDFIFHNVHLEFVAIRTAVHGSVVDFFLDTSAHRRAWRNIIAPSLEVIVAYLVFPQAIAQTLVLMCIPEDQEFLRAAVLMYCYHVVLGFRLFCVSVSFAREWLGQARQRIFDAKYLVSTELQNYHRLEGPAGEPS